MDKIYTRCELNELPAKMRKQFLRNHIQQYINQIVNVAGRGETSFFINLTNQDKNNCGQSYPPPPSPPTIEELCETLRAHFPDCDIKYEEKWIETRRNTQERMKGIAVDWS